ncbi:hypothetical protein [Thermus tengchongensis]|uniref:hypothetical protein n=1 Tax=Thermus tengchongensis TaxID=1214928 RepID=UPI001F35BFFD|nr:hypothetical protein [Thermus tengchongensis]
MPDPNLDQPQPPVQRQADLYRIAPIFVTSLAVNVYEGQVAVITFFSGIPTDIATGLISEVGMGSFALTKTQARLLGETLLRFAGEEGNEG